MTSLSLLTFHAVDDWPSVISLSPQIFQRGIGKLSESGFKTLSLEGAVQLVREGRTFPDRSVVITFDDGYKSVYDAAFPVLQHYGMGATVFLTVGETRMLNAGDRLPTLQGRHMLSWGEIREMQKGGIDFGAHTLTHSDLPGLSFDRVKKEVCESKEIIQDALGDQVTCFAYPYGHYDQRCYELVRQHFLCACSDKLGLVTAFSDFHALERVDAYYFRTERLFNLLSTPLFPWYVRMRSIPRGIRRIFRRQNLRQNSRRS